MPGAASRVNGRRGGRPKGQPNKATAEIKAIAQKHAPEAIRTLAHILKTSDNDQAKIAAARELLDRAYGKPAQAVTGEGGGPILVRWQQ